MANTPDFPLVPIDPSTPSAQTRSNQLLAAVINSLARQGKLIMSGNEFVLQLTANIGIRYRVSTTTADADPGSGVMRFNNGTEDLATKLYLSNTDTFGNDFGSYMTTWDDSTGAVKGFVTIVAEGDNSKQLIFSNTTVVDGGNYKKVNVTNSFASAASPFADGDYVWIQFQRNGDDGGTGGGTGDIVSINVDDSDVSSFITATGDPFDAGNPTGTLTIARVAASGHKVPISPADGSLGAWTVRALVEADLPSTTGFTDVAKTWTAAQTFANPGFKILDASATFAIQIQPSSTTTATRTLSIATGDANRTLDISAADVAITSFIATLLDDASASAARTTLGLGTIATQNASAVAITGGAITGTTVSGNTISAGTGTLSLGTFTLTVTNTASVSGTNTGDQTITLTGDVTGSGTGSFAATIANDAVTDAKLRNSAALSVIGRSANSTGDPADIAASNDNELLRRSGTSLGFGSLTALMDAVFGTTQGTILYRSASNWTTLSPGTANQVLCSGGAGANPSWKTLGISDGTFSGTATCADPSVISGSVSGIAPTFT